MKTNLVTLLLKILFFALIFHQTYASNSKLCSSVYESSSIKDTRKLTNKDINLDSYRTDQLRKTNATLDETLDAIWEIDSKPNITHVYSFCELMNPTWGQNTVQAKLKERNKLWNRAKNIFSKSNRPISSEQKLIQAEYLMRFEFDKFSSLPLDKVKSLFESLWSSRAGNKITLMLADAQSLAQKESIIVQYSKLWTDSAKQKIGNTKYISDALISMLPNGQIKSTIEEAMAEQPLNPLTSQLISSAIEKSKLAIGDVLELAEKTNLNETNYELWSNLLLNGLNSKRSDSKTLAVFSLYYQKVLEKDFREALYWLKASNQFRNILSDNELNLNFYRQLLAKASSETSRNIILEEIAKNGPDLLKLYVGVDVGSFNRLKSLIRLESTNSEAKSSLEKYLNSVYHDKENDEIPDLKSYIEKKYPQFRAEKISHAANSILNDSVVPGDILNLKSILQMQDQVNLELARALDSVLAANAPPARFAKLSRPWAEYLQSIPALNRSKYVLDLLQKNSGSTATLSEFISQLDPSPVVSSAVRQFLRNSRFMNSNTSDFSQEQITRMFRGTRFRQFFPHIKDAELSGAIRTKFIIAVRTDPTTPGNGLNREWLREKLDNSDIQEGIPSVYGFRPVLQYSRLSTMLENSFTGNVYGKLNEQIRGVIVQGHYEKSGNSLMERLDEERGADQIEVTAPTIVSQIERSLQSGALSKQPYLPRALFVKYWAISNNRTIIENIRSLAVQIEDRRSDFWSLRVELHNFPTNETLTRVKRYNSQMSSESGLKTKMETLITELESFLQLGKGASGIRTTIRDHLTLSDANRETLSQMTANFNSMTELAKLEQLLAIRVEYEQMKNNSQISRFRGQAALSEAGIAVMNRWLEVFSSQTYSERTKAITLVLKHLTLDGFASQNELMEWQRALTEIHSDAKLDNQEKMNLLNRIVSSIVDQVYYKMVDDYGASDNSVFQTLKNNNPIRFIDDTLRSSFLFVLSKIVDKQSAEIAIAKNIQHEIDGKPVATYVQVHNAGEAVGILRINKNPLELTDGEIAVFEEMPAESGPAAGIISVGVGARLSHLQLLAKSLKIPNVQVGRDLMDTLQPLSGQLVRLKANSDGLLKVEKVDRENQISKNLTKRRMKVPFANHEISTPISFAQLRDAKKGTYAGPKGSVLAKLYQSGRFQGHVEDGVILPFGFFNRYAERIGLQPLLSSLSQTKLQNKFLVGSIAAQIQIKINQNPVPEDMIQEVLHAIEALKTRVGKDDIGFFYRSDTNVEDLPEFNGAGLNESVPNVTINADQINKAIRSVWLSPLSEKSIYWRGLALGKTTVTVAEPSIAIMPTVKAKSSGVLITKGGNDWRSGQGSLSANFGIGSVVQAERPVEEYSFESGSLHRLSLSASRTMPVADSKGGLTNVLVHEGTTVLTLEQAQELKMLGQKVESELGDQPHGWDIEWAFDQDGRLVILQARPNM